MGVMSRATLLVWMLSQAGCFSPGYVSGDLQCASGGRCPPRMHCAGDNHCYADGSDPDLSSADDMAVSVGGMKHQGDACSPADTCDTGNCVDGFCCDQPCTADCQACHVAGKAGTCSVVAYGTPCGMTCTSSTQVQTSACNMAGNCVAASPSTCA